VKSLLVVEGKVGSEAGNSFPVLLQAFPKKKVVGF
jgi:hypothetical protein